ncbi:lysophospholipid acyltransferase family protein [Clostridium oryzae]|uniref:1-acyl-sn-glycerol-3-phosphate acyltransferase n=1 Tax=Clostridium oryzae TaxID=1450648 RepID=A0A1V4IR09_9CLOT|nr:lysophospholipid acyltransferase family protein [Clostridium oryzae]OPJ62461.1 1-acyl-sn-glycerol-3-phosphate acyltransferase [Clostridium oryzae]
MKTYYLIFKIFYFMLVKRLKKVFSKKAREEDPYIVVSNWAKYCFKITGVNLEVHGKENLPQENCLFVSNHQSYFDIPIFLASMDRRVALVSKKEVEKLPFIAYWMKLIHCVFLDRDNPREAISSINTGAENIKKYTSMVIFPEGTRSKSDNIGEFKKGSLKLGIKANAPIVPVTIFRSYKGFEENKKFTKCTIKLIIHKPIYLDNLDKVQKNNLSNSIRTTIIESYNKLLAEASAAE